MNILEILSLGKVFGLCGLAVPVEWLEGLVWSRPLAYPYNFKFKRVWNSREAEAA